jgi:uncharacterized protein (TIGR00251 family)
VDNFYKTSGEYLYLEIKVIPGASKSEMADVKDGRLRVRIAAAPEDGKANEELRVFFARTLGLAKRDIVLEKGEKSRLKTLRLPLRAREFFIS